LYENKNEIDCFPEDMARDISFHHTILYFAWRTVGSTAVVSTHIPANHLPGSMDDVCRRTFFRFGN